MDFTHTSRIQNGVGSDMTLYAKQHPHTLIEFQNRNHSKLEDTSLNEIGEQINSMLRSYNQKLLEKGFMLKRSELRKKDFIDLRNVLTYRGKSYEEYCKHVSQGCDQPDIVFSQPMTLFIDNHFWYNFIPCFNEGVIQLNTARYIHYNILNINTIEKTMDIRIRDYFRMENIWQIGVQTTAHFNFQNTEIEGHIPNIEWLNETTKKHTNIINESVSESKQITEQKYCNLATQKILNTMLRKSTHSDDMDFETIYKLIPYEEMHWTPKEISIWESLVLEYAINENHKRMEKYGTTAADDLIKIFIYAVTLSNYLLEQNKPKVLRSDNPPTKRTIIADTNTSQPKRLVRTIGNIKMTSVKPPKLPTAETIIHYKTAVWKARGGIRRMKNGKLVPFKECVKHRKCLQDTSDIPQSVIQFNKK